LDVTAQDQGIELYDIMKEQFKLKERETDLENEIGKLYEYAMMKEEKNSADNSWKLNLLAALIIPATLVLGFFSMNDVSGLNTCWQKIVSGSITILTLVVYVILLLYIRHKK
jgi:Mg2+ and Co2+ transporter CorA